MWNTDAIQLLETAVARAARFDVGDPDPQIFDSGADPERRTLTEEGERIAQALKADLDAGRKAANVFEEPGLEIYARFTVAGAALDCTEASRAENGEVAGMVHNLLAEKLEGVRSMFRSVA